VLGVGVAGGMVLRAERDGGLSRDP
jgi:hypothetical protein